MGSTLIFNYNTTSYLHCGNGIQNTTKTHNNSQLFNIHEHSESD